MVRSRIVLLAIFLLSCSFPIVAADWHITVVDPGGIAGEYCSIALDDAGNPHVSYYCDGNLKYARRTGGAWETSIVDSAGTVGKWTSLALDSENNPHISYYDETNSHVKYAHRSSLGTWENVTVNPSEEGGEYTSLVLGHSGNHRITYYCDGDLKWARWTGYEWELTTIDSTGDVGMYSSQSESMEGNPRVSYYDATNRYLKYARWDGSAWVTSIADDSGTVGWYCSLKIDSSGNPRISYYNASGDNLKYAQWGGGLWQTTTVDSSQHAGHYTSLALDGDGNPHISFYDISLSDLKYAKLTGSGWQVTTVDSGHYSVGKYSSLALDGSGNAHICYFDDTNKDLKYAEFDPSEATIGVFRPSTHTFYLDYSGNGRWDGAVVDRAYNFGLTGDQSISGDWSGLGTTKIGVFRPSTHMFYLDYSGNGVWDGAVVDRAYNFGLSDDLAVTGDWNAERFFKIGVFRPSTHMFYLDRNGNGVWDGAVTDRAYNFGLSGDLPIAGDWNADGFFKIGVYRPSTHTFYLDYNGDGRWDGAVVDRAYNFGLTGDIPVSGDWAGIGRTCIGVFRPSTHTFYLDWNGNGAWNGAGIDRSYNYGLTGDSPVSGVWG